MRGKVARTQIKTNRQSKILSKNQATPGTQMKGANGIGESQPPRNRIVVIALMRIMFAYSPRKNRAKDIALYSTKKPATISVSPSARSNGARLVSARPEMKKITNNG